MSTEQETKDAIKAIREIAAKHELAVRIFTKDDVSEMIMDSKDDIDIPFNLTDEQWKFVKGKYEGHVMHDEWDRLEVLARYSKIQ